MINGHCKWCKGKCTNIPPMFPLTLKERDPRATVNDIYHYNGWGVLMIRFGCMLHAHNGIEYGVFSHFYGAGMEPTLICSFCEEEIPDDTYNVLEAARQLWHKTMK